MQRISKMIGYFLRIGLLLALSAGHAAAVEKVTCMLDWFPNPNHVPLYVAAHGGEFAREGLEVDLVVPADPNDPLKLVAAGQIDFAVSYQPSVIMAVAEALPVVSIGALVQHPLSTILYLKSSPIHKPADLKGRRIGYSVAPLYEVLFQAVAAAAGLQTSDYELFRVGFNLVPPLLSGQVDAVIGAFRNYEAIQIELEGKAVGIMPLEENGIPDFYELVIIANAQAVERNPRRVEKFIAALTRGIQTTLTSPQAALDIFLKQHPDLRDDLNRKAFEVTLPFFRGSPTQTLERWETLQRFMQEHGLVTRTVPVKRLVWQGAP